jgi:hypothetical protein
MPSTSDFPEKVKFIVKADSGTETFIVDQTLELKKRGVGSFSTELNPGIYKIRFRAGSLIKEIRQEVKPGSSPVEITPPPLKFSSPALLENTGKTHEYQMEAACRLSQQTHKNLGSGSELFVFVRDWTESNKRSSQTGRHPGIGLTLHDLQGNLLLDFQRESKFDLGQPGKEDPWAGCNVKVAPGSYRLRVQTLTWGALEQVVVASLGWQTQVFLLLSDFGNDAGTDLRADLSDASILLSQIGCGFDPNSTDLRLAELARIGLANRRTTLAQNLLRQLLETKFYNPMLGIYGAHAILSASEPDKVLLGEVVNNLKQLVGHHPDVDALGLYLSDSVSDATMTFDTPPMLSRSWDIVVAKAAEKFSLVSEGSLAARISEHLWGSGPWLVWLADELEETSFFETFIEPRSGIARLSEIVLRLEKDKTGRPKVDVGLSDYEGAVLLYLTKQQKKNRISTDAELVAPLAQSELSLHILSDSTVKDLARKLGVPPVTVQATVRGLLRKLETPELGLPGQDVLPA